MAEERAVRAAIYAESNATVNVGQLLVFRGAPFTLHLPSPPLEDTRSAVEALRPAAAAVPIGDEAIPILSSIRAWREGPMPLGVAVIRGGAGTGKSRIALEALREALADGWGGGFLHATPEEASTGTWGLDGHALIVIDYAEASPSTVLRVLSTIDAVASQEARQRVLLLMRAKRSRRRLADELVAFGRGAVDNDDLRRTLANAVEISLEDEAFRPSEPELAALYQRALAAFARMPSLGTGRLPLPASPPYVGRAPFTTPLLVSAAALLEVIGEAKADASSPADAVLDEVLAHERRYWIRRLEDLHLAVDPSRRDLAGALFTVAPGAVLADAADLLRALPGLESDSVESLRDEIATWWLATYPSHDGRIRAVEPDLIGERLIAQVLERAAEAGDAASADMLLRVVERANLSGRRALLRTLTRAAPDTPLLRAKLRELLKKRVETLVADARDELCRTDLPEPLAVTLTLAVQVAGGIDDADVVAERLVGKPRPDMTMLELRPLVAALAASGAEAHASDPDRRASALSLQATMTGLIGRPEDALEASAEAVRVRRELVAQSRELYEPSLVKALTTYSNRLADIGERDLALNAAEEAVTRCRSLVEEGRLASRIDLAVGLNNLSARRAAVGEPDSALAAARESVAVLAELVAGPEGDIYAADHAMALSTLANRLNALRDFEGALDAAIASLGVRERLAAVDPDLHEPNLALVLNNIAMIYGNLDRREEALTAALEAVAIRERLAEKSPEVHLVALARALNTAANRHAALGQDDDAVARARQALAALGQLSPTRQRAAFAERAGIANNLAAALCSAGRAAEAADEAEAALRQLEGISGGGSESTLAALLTTLSAARHELGELDAAIEAARSSLALRRALADRSPGAYAAALRGALSTLADLLDSAGGESEARALRAEAAEIKDGDAPR